MIADRQVAAVLLLRDDDAALLQHRDETPGLPRAGMWVPPGGHCEPDEPPEACARREFEEETAYALGRELRYLARVRDDVGAGPAEWLTVFWAPYDGVRQPVCGEGQALEFVARQRAEALCVPALLVSLWDRAIQARRSSPPRS